MKAMVANNKILWLCLSLMVLAGGCTVGTQSHDDKELQIAEQFGLAYAPLVVIKEKSMMQDHGVQVEWIQLNNASAIREAMLSSHLDIGFMGIPPYLIGKDNDMGWEVFTGLTKAELALVSNNEDINALTDIERQDRIILPQPGSIQHILLAMAAEKEFGDAQYFDEQLLSMSHPDGLQALKNSKDPVLLFTAPPYVAMALQEPKFQKVLTGVDAFGGPFTFIVGVASETAWREKKSQIDIFQTVLREAILWMEQYPEDAADLLAPYYQITHQEMMNYLQSGELVYALDVQGMERFQEFMLQVGYIKKEEALR